MKYDQLKRLQIRVGGSVKAAMKQMDVTGFKILFVVDENKKLIGTITDGDFRKWILSGNSLESGINGVFNKKPIKFDKSYDPEEVKKALLKYRIESVPIVDPEGMLIDVLFWEDFFSEGYKKRNEVLNIPVAIMAGGIGSRFSTVTKILPKPLIPFGEKPIIEVIMENFSYAGCNAFYLLLGYKGAMVRSYFENANSDINPVFISETEPGGTAGALRLLPYDSLPRSFFVSNCDIVIETDYADIYDFHNGSGSDITIVSAMSHFVIPYGVLEMTTGGLLKDIKEKPEYDYLVNTGMYLLKKESLSFIPEKGPFDFTDLLKAVREKGGKVSIYPVSERSWFDIGQPRVWEESTDRLSELSKTKENIRKSINRTRDDRKN